MSEGKLKQVCGEDVSEEDQTPDPVCVGHCDDGLLRLHRARRCQVPGERCHHQAASP